MTWDEINQLRARLEARLEAYSFPGELLHGALRIAGDADNPVRGNAAAGLLRELITWTLHTLAPDAEVTASSWYKDVKGAKNPTREARATYITQGGLSAAYVAEELGIDTEDLHRPLLDAMQELNKYTHLKEGTVLAADEEVRELVGSTLGPLLTLFEEAEACRQSVCAELIDHIDREIMDRLLSETIDDLDVLSTHTTVEGHQIDDLKVIGLDHQTVVYGVEGTVYANLQYGSSSDMRRGDGAQLNESYPFTAQFSAPVEDPEAVEFHVDIEVDNSSFYE